MISDNTDDAYSLYLYAHVIIRVENLMKRKQRFILSKYYCC